jgi:MOSC domain-containing protein YiiM
VSVLRVCSVNTGRASQIGARHHQPVVSAIGKQPITSADVVIGWLNIDGDEQADRSVHGGIDKAVYVYPQEHFAHWQSNGIAASAGTFGENITSQGLTETDVHLGDRWTWGTSELIVTQPRNPCYKLAMRLQRPDVAKLMINTATCGWYLRVLRPGIAAITDPMHRTLHRADAPTVSEAFAWTLRQPRQGANIRRLLATPELAAQYAESIAALASTPDHG